MKQTKEYFKNWAKKNRKHLREYQAEYRKNNFDKIKKSKQKYAEKLKVQRRKIRKDKENNKYF